MRCNLHVGQKVVCIYDGALHDGASPVARPLLREGEIYTIRAIGYPPAWQHRAGLIRRDTVGVLLFEVDRSWASRLAGGVGEGVYDHARFRPLYERETDISIFTAMLDEAPQFVDA